MEVSDSYHWQREFWQVLQTESTQNIPGFSGALRYQVVGFFLPFFCTVGEFRGKASHSLSCQMLQWFMCPETKQLNTYLSLSSKKYCLCESQPHGEHTPRTQTSS